MKKLKKKNKIFWFFSYLDSFGSILEPKHCNFVFKTTRCVAGFFVFERFESFNPWNPLEALDKFFEKGRMVQIVFLGWNQGWHFLDKIAIKSMIMIILIIITDYWL